MATDHRGNPINENNLAKTNAERMRQSDDDNNPTFEDELKYMDETGIDPMTGRNLYGEPDDDGLGDTRSDELSEQHQREDSIKIQRDENGDILDHSAMLPSQHQTGSGYGY